MEIKLPENPTFKDVREFFDKYNISIVDGDVVEALRRENEELQAKLDKAKDALRFYSQQNHIETHGYGNQNYQCYDDIYIENGQRARTTLEEIK